jgi:hypothetical protein
VRETSQTTEQRLSIGITLWSWFMIPHALLAGVQLIATPGRTESFFFWRIEPRLNAVLFGVVYLIAGIALAQATLSGRWERRRFFVPMLVAFSVVLLAATALHPGRFFPGFKFTYWVVVYLLVPVGEIAAFRLSERRGASWSVGLTPVRPLTRMLATVAGAAVALLTVLCVLAPGLIALVWPTALSPLMARVFGAAFAAIAVGLLWTRVESDWTRISPVASMMIWFAALGIAAPWLHRGDLTGGPVRLAFYLAGLVAVGAIGIALRRLQHDVAA